MLAYLECAERVHQDRTAVLGGDQMRDPVALVGRRGMPRGRLLERGDDELHRRDSVCRRILALSPRDRTDLEVEVEEEERDARSPVRQPEARSLEVEAEVDAGEGGTEDVEGDARREVDLERERVEAYERVEPEMSLCTGDTDVGSQLDVRSELHAVRCQREVPVRTQRQEGRR